MRRATMTAIGMACTLALAAAVPGAAQTALPTGSTLLDQHVEAIGGKAASDKLSVRVTRGRIEVANAGISITLTNWTARPNRVRSVAESEVVGRIERGFDGSVAWEVSTTAGPRLLDGVQLDNAVRDSPFDGLVSWRAWVARADTQEVAQVDGKPAYKVLVTPKRGSTQTVYFDQASSLAVKIESVAASTMGDVPVETWLGDYRAVDGVKIAHVVRQNAAGRQVVTTIESVVHAIEVPAGQFDPPKEVLALLKK
jgi:hypothetical protein